MHIHSKPCHTLRISRKQVRIIVDEADQLLLKGLRPGVGSRGGKLSGCCLHLVGGQHQEEGSVADWHIHSASQQAIFVGIGSDKVGRVL